MVHFSSKTMENTRQCDDIFKELKGKNASQESYSAK